MSDDPNALGWLKQKVVEIQQYRAQDRKDINELQDENQELRERLAAVETTIGFDAERVEYDEMTRDQKVRELRVASIRRGLKTSNGVGKMTYRDVMALFDNHPSPGHVYDLMQDAGGADGFEYREFKGRDRTNALYAIPSEIQDETLVQAASSGMLDTTG